MRATKAVAMASQNRQKYTQALRNGPYPARPLADGHAPPIAATSSVRVDLELLEGLDFWRSPCGGAALSAPPAAPAAFWRMSRPRAAVADAKYVRADLVPTSATFFGRRRRRWYIGGVFRDVLDARSTLYRVCRRPKNVAEVARTPTYFGRHRHRWDVGGVFWGVPKARSTLYRARGPKKRRQSAARALGKAPKASAGQAPGFRNVPGPGRTRRDRVGARIHPLGRGASSQSRRMLKPPLYKRHQTIVCCRVTST